MSEKLQRESVKYIRDYIKKSYKTKDCCFICDSKEKLELHHIYSLSDLFSSWCKENNIKDITTSDEIKELRVRFQKDTEEKLSNDNLYTLCKKHHLKLHNIYGQAYSLFTAEKVKRWLLKMKDKQTG